MIPDPAYKSSVICRAAQISMRMLQWWDEGDVVSPTLYGHLRIYSETQFLQVLVLSRLRRKGMSLQRARHFIPHLKRMSFEPGLILLVTHKGAPFFTKDNEEALRRAEVENSPVYVIRLDALYAAMYIERGRHDRHKTDRVA